MIIYYIALLLLAIFPAVVILSLVYKRDKEKEPKKLLVALFGVGIVSCFFTLLLSSVSEFLFPFMSSKALEQNEGNYFILILHAFVQVGFIEELSKWLFNYSIIWNHKEFDHIYDSVVYAVFVSLGFATFENMLYVLTGGIATGIIRAVVSVPAHAFFAVNMGYYIGLAKLCSINSKKKMVNKYKIYSVMIPTFLHGLFDFGLMSENLLLVLMSFGLVVYLYVTGIKRTKQLSNVSSRMINKKQYCYTCKDYRIGNYCHFCGNKL